MPKILFVDDHPLYREGLVHALSGHPLRAEVVAVSSAAEAVQVLDSDPTIELALVDRRLNGEDGLVVMLQIGARHPDVARMLISAEVAPELAYAAMQSGAQGFLSKAMSVSDMIAGIQRVLDGDTCWPATMASDAQPEPAVVLTQRQIEVLQLLAEGRSNAQMALALGIAERTVKAHLGAVFQALGADSRTRALVRARQLGLTP